MEWYINAPGAEAPLGPFSSDLIVQGIQAGRIPPNATVCALGSNEWQPLTRIPEFGAATLGIPQASIGPVAGISPGAVASASSQSDAFGQFIIALPVLGGIACWALPTMAHLVAIGVVVVTAALIGVDQSRWGMSGVQSPIGALFLWVIGFPAYFHTRAKNGAPKRLGSSIGAMVFLFAGLALPALSASTVLPACESPEATRTALSALMQSPAWQANNLQGDITNPGEVRYRADPPRRICRAQLTTKLGPEVLFYSVEWQNRSKGLIWVQIIGNHDDGYLGLGEDGNHLITRARHRNPRRTGEAAADRQRAR